MPFAPSRVLVVPLIKSKIAKEQLTEQRHVRHVQLTFFSVVCKGSKTRCGCHHVTTLLQRVKQREFCSFATKIHEESIKHVCQDDDM